MTSLGGALACLLAVPACGGQTDSGALSPDAGVRGVGGAAVLDSGAGDSRTGAGGMAAAGGAGPGNPDVGVRPDSMTSAPDAGVKPDSSISTPDSGGSTPDSGRFGPGPCGQVCGHLFDSCPAYFRADCEQRCIDGQELAADQGTEAEFSNLLTCCSTISVPFAKCADEGPGQLGFEDCDDDDLCGSPSSP